MLIPANVFWLASHVMQFLNIACVRGALISLAMENHMYDLRKTAATNCQIKLTF